MSQMNQMYRVALELLSSTADPVSSSMIRKGYLRDASIMV